MSISHGFELGVSLHRPLARMAEIGSSPALLHAGAVVLGIGFKSILLLTVFGIACACLRRASAALRHALWLIALACLILLPVVSLWQACLPPRVLRPLTLRSPLPLVAPSTANRSVPVVIKVTVLPSSATVVAPAQTTYRLNTSAQPASYLNAEMIAWARRLVAWLPVVWFAGTLLLLARLASSLALAWEIAGRCIPIGEGRIRSMAANAVRQLGHLGRLSVRLGEWGGAPSVPMTLGIVRPVVLLPAEAIDWPPDRVNSALLHEIAHIRRRDWAWQVLASAACALYWFNPLVWLAASSLRAESEMACDDLVLLAGAPAADYAGHLLEIARTLSRSRRRVPTAVAAASRPQIEGRLRAILDRARSRRPLAPRARTLALVFAVLLLVPLALMRWETKASVELRAQVAPLMHRLALPPALAAGATHISLAMKGKSLMTTSKLLSLNPRLARAAATLASLSLITVPAATPAQSAPAAAPPAASSPAANPPAVPNSIPAPTPVAPAPSTTPPAAPMGMVPAPGSPEPVSGGTASPSAPVEVAVPTSAQAAVPVPSSADTSMESVFIVPDSVPGTIVVKWDGSGYFDIGAKDAPSSVVIARLCQVAGVKYQVSPTVKGNMTIALGNTPFVTALEMIGAASNPPFTYEVVNSEYRFFAKPDYTEEYYDVMLPKKTVSLDLDSANIAQALKELFDTANASYTLQLPHGPAAQAPITLHLHNIPFGAALRALLGTTSPELGYSVQDGIVYIKPAQVAVTLQSLVGQATPSYQVNQPYVYKPGDWKALSIQSGDHSTP